MKWSANSWKESLPTSSRTSGQDAHESSTETELFPSLQQRGLIPVWLCRAKCTRCTKHTLEEQTLEGSETKEVPQSAELSITGPASDR